MENKVEQTVDHATDGPDTQVVSGPKTVRISKQAKPIKYTNLQDFLIKHRTNKKMRGRHLLETGPQYQHTPGSVMKAVAFSAGHIISGTMNMTPLCSCILARLLQKVHQST